MKAKALIVFGLIVVLCLAAPVKVIAIEEELIKLGITALWSLFGDRGGNKDITPQQIEERLTNNIKVGLNKKGYQVSDIKLVGATSLSEKMNVAFFSLKLNGNSGICYYLIEKGKSIQSNSPDALNDFQEFLKLANPERRLYLKALFEQVAKIKIELSS